MSDGCSEQVVILGVFSIGSLKQNINADGFNLQIRQRLDHQRIEVPPNRPAEILHRVIIDVHDNDVGIRLHVAAHRYFNDVTCSSTVESGDCTMMTKSSKKARREPLQRMIALSLGTQPEFGILFFAVLPKLKVQAWAIKGLPACTDFISFFQR